MAGLLRAAAAAGVAGGACLLAKTTVSQSHCMVPCGIFDDPRVVCELKQDAATIKKDVNQCTRWVMTKEDHADKIIKTTAEYMLAQRVKAPAFASRADYAGGGVVEPLHVNFKADLEWVVLSGKFKVEAGPVNPVPGHPKVADTLVAGSCCLRCGARAAAAAPVASQSRQLRQLGDFLGSGPRDAAPSAIDAPRRERAPPTPEAVEPAGRDAGSDATFRSAPGKFADLSPPADDDARRRRSAAGEMEDVNAAEAEAEDAAPADLEMEDVAPADEEEMEDVAPADEDEERASSGSDDADDDDDYDDDDEDDDDDDDFEREFGAAAPRRRRGTPPSATRSPHGLAARHPGRGGVAPRASLDRERDAVVDLTDSPLDTQTEAAVAAAEASLDRERGAFDLTDSPLDAGRGGRRRREASLDRERGAAGAGALASRRVRFATHATYQGERRYLFEAEGGFAGARLAATAGAIAAAEAVVVVDLGGGLCCLRVGGVEKHASARGRSEHFKVASGYGLVRGWETFARRTSAAAPPRRRAPAAAARGGAAAAEAGLLRRQGAPRRAGGGGRRRLGVAARAVAGGVVLDPAVSDRLRDHQRAGVAFLLERARGAGAGGGPPPIRGAILADGMGLGKTAMALSAVHGLLQQGGARKAAVLCPASVLDGWKREIAKLMPKCMRPVVLRQSEYEYPGANPKTASYRALDEHLPRACARLLLTGTPAQNDLGELRALVALAAGDAGDATLWRGAAKEGATEADGAALRRFVAPAVLRRDAREALARSLPPLEDRIVFVDLSATQRRLYDAFLETKAARRAASSNRRGTDALGAAGALRLLCCHPALWDRGEAAGDALEPSIPKAKRKAPAAGAAPRVPRWKQFRRRKKAAA
ncbi:hypothetical protein JL722_951 [Aureococcus anophagefferens]|nr:hypothetical protein JL722_951 [Aureococcus anophagefferens]